ncbi:hypothetical protein [Microbacterium trichothecenolyticum]|uniref:Single-stranded DNA-binding protein n=1 Tax=Microbacterium trichothecenolyticum TaxID=69370 RepID=A0A0M2HMD6_MICTR|nr:hypothetical protein [Microbacterium trichothecenolyticum]KJL45589.1 hypothetical protein RS82_00141 [Microbacterium trichothecenolyticum]
MAIVTVEGTVSRINQNGVGFGVKESWQGREGREAHRYWSAWMPDNVPVQVVVGDAVKITGPLRTQVDRDPRFVAHTVSNAKVEITRENGPRSWAPDNGQPPADEYPPDDPYADGTAWSTAQVPA